ncbi:SDH-like protein [Mya arenaria]|uniref:SDH-like protein n=1 Tax=Mya arenaria TaxID=6604 RepID=A0ABY7ER90_MYAAR|nr:SDH-like protein [Mya arenaria]
MEEGRDVLPYFIKSEDMQLPEFASSPFHGKGGPLAVSTRYDFEITQFFIQAGQELGYNRTDYNGYDQEGFGVVQSNTRNGIRSSTSIDYLRSARHRPNFHILLRSFGTKVDIKNDCAVGVYYIKDSKKHYVKARKEIIISGGAVNSPQPLMLSGIGPKRHLSDLGIPVVADLPVGENLQDHMTIMFHSQINKQYGIISEEILQTVWNKIQYVIFGTGPLSATGLGGSAFIHLDPQSRGKNTLIFKW